ncbi:MAG TPA: aminopeptidase P family protein [Thermoanaerobacterales bacterium]|nr:aminopeptidase P family protein [Thermoanaerobacterales bacterium]
MVWSRQEYELKLGRIRSLMQKEGFDYLLITTQVNFRWLTGGRPYVNMISETSCGAFLVTEEKVFLVSNNIEAARLVNEELNMLPLEKVEYPWWEAGAMDEKLKKLAGGKKIVLDVELGLKFNMLRWDLLPEEQQRFKDTGRCVGKILEEVAYKVKPGDSELDVARLIAMTSASYGVVPYVNLAAADDRAFCYRHPLPTEKKIEKYLLMAVSGEKHGLFASASRLVHFGEVPEDLKKRHEAVLKVDAAFIGATVPGAIVKDIFGRGKKAYESVGFSGEWKNHHQGGMAGYNSREFRATDNSEEKVKEGQVYAWNPTIAGVKSEDTILVTQNGREILTASDNFPTEDVEYEGFIIKRPSILIR